ncbi:MAG: hypothetical protein ACTSYQ_02205 [Candidatus Odinarchaeia archaeon]
MPSRVTFNLNTSTATIDIGVPPPLNTTFIIITSVATVISVSAVVIGYFKWKTKQIEKQKTEQEEQNKYLI